MTTSQIIASVARGWKQSRCGLASDIIVRDEFPLPNFPHSARHSRWCVFVTFAARRWHEHPTRRHEGYCSLDGDVFLGEFDTQKQANRAVGQFRRHLYAVYDAA